MTYKEYDKDAVRNKIGEINKLLNDVCDMLPAGASPELDVSYARFATLSEASAKAQMRVKLSVTLEPETF